MKLALQGHSILIASGDYGVGSFPQDGVENGDTGCLGDQGTVFNPQYGSCPYILSVGATMLYPNQTVLDPESVMNVNLTASANFTSAGGFSNYFPAPSWQTSAVSKYFAKHDPGYPYYETFGEYGTDLNPLPDELYNRIGRAYPDVAANGVGFKAFTNGIDRYWHGTSLSSPLFAFVLTLVSIESLFQSATLIPA